MIFYHKTKNISLNSRWIVAKKAKGNYTNVIFKDKYSAEILAQDYYLHQVKLRYNVSWAPYQQYSDEWYSKYYRPIPLFGDTPRTPSSCSLSSTSKHSPSQNNDIVSPLHKQN